jgi:glycosyltransferase involved in cell wall biosynthesis
MSPKKVLLVCNTGWNLFNFRRPIARILREQGFEPVLVSPRDEYVAKLEAEGYRWIELKLQRRSLNPWSELKSMLELMRIYRREKPAAVHHFTIKCVIYGSLAARAVGIQRVINGITGLGHVFIDDRSVSVRFVRPLIRWAYRWALRGKHTRFIFQNSEDLDFFESEKLIVRQSAVLIKSSGVDLKRFTPDLQAASKTPLVLFASRLIKEKGIYEFVEAAKTLGRRNVRARFEIAGEMDPGNPSTLTATEIEQWSGVESVEFIGKVDEIEKKLAQATMVVLPSYREGVPRILLEASAMERPIVTTDVPGCRETVRNGANGILVPAQDAEALADAIEALISDPRRCEEMGRAGRQLVLEEFDDRSVARATWKIYEDLGIKSVS